MREILFRGKRIDNGEWVEGYPFGVNAIIPLDAKYTVTSMGTVLHDILEVGPATVGQYTGLVDKNGRKIFEGDVVKQGDEIGEVYYERNYCTFAIILKRNMDLFKHIKYNCEITGNIHDNPELLR